MINYLLEILIAIDQLGNTLLGGWADETMSARAWRTKSFFYIIIDKIFFFMPEHCKNSYEAEQSRAQSPIEER